MGFYPLLTDYNIVIFFCMPLLNLRFVRRQLEGQELVGLLFCFLQILTAVTWKLWMERFPANANFYYFPTVIHNMVAVAAYIAELNSLSCF
mmetsp:Transcript_18183/g.31115  ORF Transcript_18183/g.31115 Transcript_18183/m.31115 type:complete len:91 (-) Transcript_18183:57-329(-)